MNNKLYFNLPDHITSTIVNMAFKMGVLKKGALPVNVCSDNSAIGVCKKIYGYIVNSSEDNTDIGFLSVCAGIKAAKLYLTDNTVLNESDINDMLSVHHSSIVESFSLFTDIEYGSEECEDFINRTDALFTAAVNLITEDLQLHSDCDIADCDNNELIYLHAMLLMYRLGTAIQLQAV